jgi:hypothetical protein
MSATDTCYFLRQYRLKRRLRMEQEKKLQQKPAQPDECEGLFDVLEALCGEWGRVMP